MTALETQIPQLINNLSESLSVEVKNWLGGLADRNEQACLAKEIIALANHGGGLIFIGFSDDEGHPSMDAPEGELASYTQDNISNIVERYVSPPCQCTLGFYSREGEDARHPVILVPGNHRVPLFAARGSPDNSLQVGRVYVRRQGGRSEAARTQDDWEKLLDRLVRARQSDQLDAIRGIINPSPNALILEEERNALEDWETESLAQWQNTINQLPDNDARRFAQGYWYVVYKIHPFNSQNLNELQNVLRNNIHAYSGWRPFTFLARDDRRPRPMGNVVQAWLGENDDGEHSDFWRVSQDGYAFLLRPYQEDREGYGGHINPGPPIPVLDWILPIYRMTEVFHHLEALAEEFSPDNAQFEFKLKYVNVRGRQLWRRGRGVFLETRGPCLVDDVENTISGNVEELTFNLNETIWRLLSPIYAQFDFAELGRGLVDRIVAQVHNYPNN